MTKKTWSKYVFWIILMEITAGCTWWIMRGGIELYRQSAVKPGLAPPAALFFAVWAVLFALMGVSIARIRIAPRSTEGATGANHFIMQLIMNFFWGQVFFNSQTYGLALAWLAVQLVFIVLMIRSFYKADRTAAWLQVPNLLWVIFSGYLNFSVWMLNR